MFDVKLDGSRVPSWWKEASAVPPRAPRGTNAEADGLDKLPATRFVHSVSKYVDNSEGDSCPYNVRWSGERAPPPPRTPPIPRITAGHSVKPDVTEGAIDVAGLSTIGCG